MMQPGMPNPWGAEPAGTVVDPVQAGAGWLSGVPGQVGDMVELVKLLSETSRGDMSGLFDESTAPGTTDWVGDTIGADPSDPSFQAGSMLSPGIPGGAELTMALKALPALLGTKKVRKPGRAFDPRFDNRVNEQPRLKGLNVETHEVPDPAPEISIFDLEGMPFVTSMSDRTSAGSILTGINGVELDRLVELLGGQDFMFHNPGQVWASGLQPVNSIMKQARLMRQEHGVDPLFMPWRMSPSGGDFANMGGEAMLSFAASNMDTKTIGALDSNIRKWIPNWSGVRSPDSVKQYRNAPDTARKAIQNMMDVGFRDRGGLSRGESRLAVADPKQIITPDTGLMNVGRIFSQSPIADQTRHPSYPFGVPGEGIGRLKEDVRVHQFLPGRVEKRGIIDPRLPTRQDIRSLQGGAYSGIISEELLRVLADQ